MTLPEGFVLDGQLLPAQTGLPDGFVLDAAPQRSVGGLGQAIQSVWEKPPEGPSLIGLAKGLWSGATLPGEVARGKVDPLSDEAIGRSLNLAGGIALSGTAAPAGALGSGLVRPSIEAAVKKAGVPTAQELKAAGSAGFDAMRAEGLEVHPKVLTDFSAKVRNELENKGIDEIVAPKTMGVLEKAAAAPDGSTVTITNLHNLRKKLGNVAGSPDATERMAAVTVKNALDDLIESMPGRTGSLLKEANANFAAGERASAIDKKQIQAELRASATHSGQNVANTIRQRMATVAGEPRYMRGYSPAETAAVTKIAEGTPFTNITRYGGKLLGGGGGLGQLAAGAFAGHAVGGPLGLAAPLAGIGLTKLSNAATVRQAQALSELLRSRSPEAVRRQAIAALEAALANPELGGGLLGGMLARNPQGLLGLLNPPTANSR